MSNTRTRFDDFFRDRAIAFANDVGHLDTSGIPEPHLPLWGINYDTSPFRFGLIGEDTNGWGEMCNFIQGAKDNPIDAIHRFQDKFESFEFTGWTNNFGTSFWDTSLKFLAALHGIVDWKILKRREDESALRSFFWANVNSVELYKHSPESNDVSYEVWRSAKDASERHFDSLSGILDIFRPHLVIIMDWDCDRNTSWHDITLDWDEFAEHQACAFYKETNTHILCTAHPSWLNKNSLYDVVVNGIIQRANKVLKVSNDEKPVSQKEFRELAKHVREMLDVFATKDQLKSLNEACSDNDSNIKNLCKDVQECRQQIEEIQSELHSLKQKTPAFNSPADHWPSKYCEELEKLEQQILALSRRLDAAGH